MQGEREITEKLAIIVLGSMCSGKSSFVRMLTSRDSHDRIKVSGGQGNCTYECSLFELSDEVKKRLNIAEFGKPIYIVDTPGLNSEKCAYVISKQIQELIIKEKLLTIAILYLVKPGERLTNSSGNNVYKYIHEIFPFKRKTK